MDNIDIIEKELDEKSIEKLKEMAISVPEPTPEPESEETPIEDGN